MTEFGEKTFKRAVWKHCLRWLLFVFLVGLNIAMPGSLIERLIRHVPIQPGPEAVQFLFLLLCDLYMLPSAVFEVNSVTVRDGEVILGCLLWKSKLKKDQIVSFKIPKMLTWALLRTPRCFYLINRADFGNFEELATLIEQRVLN
ncbi:MAG: hypothetical protein JSS83_23970 [Cyanobacteria bacterium SZAS LIN-3]|nr:hypothetical protein [Cyanobacteria bacterium SZAS LIN-3]